MRFSHLLVLLAVVTATAIAGAGDAAPAVPSEWELAVAAVAAGSSTAAAGSSTADSGGRDLPPDTLCFDHSNSDSCTECTDVEYYDEELDRTFGCIWCQAKKGTTQKNSCRPDWLGITCPNAQTSCEVSYWYAYLILGIVFALVFGAVMWCFDRGIMSHAGLPEKDCAQWLAPTDELIAAASGLDGSAPRKVVDTEPVGVLVEPRRTCAQRFYRDLISPRAEIDFGSGSYASLRVGLSFSSFLWVLIGMLAIMVLCVVIVSLSSGHYAVMFSVLFIVVSAPLYFVRRTLRLSDADQRVSYDVSWAFCFSCTRERTHLHQIERCVVFQTVGAASRPAPLRQSDDDSAPEVSDMPPIPLVAITPDAEPTHNPVRSSRILIEPASASASASAPAALASAGAQSPSSNARRALNTTDSPSDGDLYYSIYVVCKSGTEFPVVIRKPLSVAQPVYRRLIRILAANQTLIAANGSGGDGDGDGDGDGTEAVLFDAAAAEQQKRRLRIAQNAARLSSSDDKSDDPVASFPALSAGTNAFGSLSAAAATTSGGDTDSTLAASAINAAATEAATASADVPAANSSVRISDDDKTSS